MNSQLKAGIERHGVFAGFIAISIVLFWKTIGALVYYSLHQDSSSHIVLIPFISAYLLVTERKRIFVKNQPARGPGIVVVLAGVVLYWAAGHFYSAATYGNLTLSAATFSLVVIWIGSFASSYGLDATRAAAFPLLFLLLMIPLPDRVLDKTVYFLQQGSTEIAYLLFKTVGVPVLRQGFVLTVPGFSIEVATECSGIRSSMALFITCLLAAHLFLRSAWKRVALVLLSFPLALIKNGVRIATLTLLSMYVDPSFLKGSLHRDGGFAFFLLALAMIFPIFLAFERSDSREFAKSNEETTTDPARSQAYSFVTGK
jgi:exosortase